MLKSHEVPTSMASSLKFSHRGDALIGQKMFEMLDLARRHEEQGKKVYHLELGNPRLAPPPELLDGAQKSLRDLDVGYCYSAGHPALRQAIVKEYNDADGAHISEANVIISPANFIISQFLDLVCNAGDYVVFFTPAFPTYWAGARHIGLNVDAVPLDPAQGFDLTDDAVDRAIALKPKAMIVNSANNPTGAVYNRAVLRRLAEECERHGIWLLSDETYGKISFGKEFYSLADMNLPHLVIMSSFSKIFSVPGFRTGFAIAHPDVAAKLALSSSTQFSCLPIFTQLGCVAAMKNFHGYTSMVAQRCATITEWCSNTLRTNSKLKFTTPQSGFYFFIDISPSGLSDLDFALKLLEKEYTAVTAGSSFGPAFSSFVRIATCGDENDVREGTTRLIKFFDSLTKA